MSHRALIIEDNENNMALISFILEAAGYETLSADTGEDGYLMAIGEQPDFIILDIQLPDIDGMKVAKKLHANERTRKIPTVAMTSYAMSGEREKLMLAGCSGYIEKPIDPENIIRQIERML